jgi:DNA mismatch endonuclease (patch repair protein)
MKGKHNGRWIKEIPIRETRTCLTCGNPFLILGVNKDQKYCSRECYYTSPITKMARSRCRVGELNTSKNPQVREKIRKARLHQVFPGKDTEPEKLLESGLISLGVRYKKHTAIENICQPDFILPELKLAIFVDGDYWHGNPEIYPEDKLGRVQRFNIQRDISANQELRKRNWTVLRFWENQIKSDVEKCKETILNEIKRMATDR